MGRALHRRSDRLPHAARRRARVASPRAEVANTIRYRRRKGTASMLEQLARDVTGWPAPRRVLRAARDDPEHEPRSPTARRPPTCATRRARVADAQAARSTPRAHRRHPADRVARGRHNIPNVGIFLWRMRRCRRPHASCRGRRRPAAGSASIRSAPTSRSSPTRGRDDITHLAEPADVPLPLTAAVAGPPRRVYHGAGPVDPLGGPAGPGRPTRPSNRRRGEVCDLSDDPDDLGSWRNQPGPGRPAGRVRPAPRPRCLPRSSGRRARPASPPTTGGRPWLIGGGGYDRSRSTSSRCRSWSRPPRGSEDPPWPAAHVGGRRRGGRRSWTAAATTSRDDHRDDAGANGPDGDGRTAVRKSHPAAARPEISSDWPSSRHDGRPQRPRARRRAARDRGGGRHRAAHAGPPPLHARARASRATPTASRTRSAGRA